MKTPVWVTNPEELAAQALKRGKVQDTFKMQAGKHTHTHKTSGLCRPSNQKENEITRKSNIKVAAAPTPFGSSRCGRVKTDEPKAEVKNLAGRLPRKLAQRMNDQPRCRRKARTFAGFSTLCW